MKKGDIYYNPATKAFRRSPVRVTGIDLLMAAGALLILAATLIFIFRDIF